MERLEGETAKFRDALFGSTYPQGVLDAIYSVFRFNYRSV
jgi:hypothetical protein